MKKHEPDDPMELYGEEVMGDARIMLDCIVQEYAGQGMDAAHILSVFELPFYQATHRLYVLLGRETVLEAIKKAVECAYTITEIERKEAQK